jgi:two-component system chemotaxis response regulator CheY
MKSLVVDDDRTSCLVLEEVLSGFGPVDSCADGAEAVRVATDALVGGDPYDLICMDLLMPKMNGLEAIQSIRREEERIGSPHQSRIVAITGSEDSGTIREALLQYSDAYIVKPVDTRAFLNIVRCLCEVDGRPA